MEIKVTVIHELGEGALKVLSALLAGPGAQPLAAKEAPVVNLQKTETVKEKAKTEKTAPVKTTAATNGAAQPKTEAGETGEIDLPAIRAKVVSLRDAGKKDKTLEIMTAYSITKLSDLPEDKYTEFMDKLNAVK